MVEEVVLMHNIGATIIEFIAVRLMVVTESEN
jgi:hypothetical protein